MAGRVSRNSQLAQIHIAAKDCHMTEDIYRDFMEVHTGKRSAAELDMHGRFKLLKAFETVCGWKPKKKRYQSKNNTKLHGADSKFGYEHDTSRLMIVKWRELAKAGKVNDNSARAMETWIANQTRKPGQQLPRRRSPDTLNGREANALIERLKEWVKR